MRTTLEPVAGIYQTAIGESLELGGNLTFHAQRWGAWPQSHLENVLTQTGPRSVDS